MVGSWIVSQLSCYHRFTAHWALIHIFPTIYLLFNRYVSVSAVLPGTHLLTTSYWLSKIPLNQIGMDTLSLDINDRLIPVVEAVLVWSFTGVRKHVSIFVWVRIHRSIGIMCVFKSMIFSLFTQRTHKFVLRNEEEESIEKRNKKVEKKTDTRRMFWIMFGVGSH